MSSFEIIRSKLEIMAATKDRLSIENIAAIMTLRWLDGRDSKEVFSDNVFQTFISNYVVTPKDSVAMLRIYCDGSCLNNGKTGISQAAFGVYVTRDDIEVFKHSEKIPESLPQTNQRAELSALLYALQYASENGGPTISVEIYTDSKYAINCIETWGPTWESKDWKKYDGKPIHHLDLVQPCVSILKSCKDFVSLHYIAAHTGKIDIISRGNDMADRLARSIH